MHITAEEKSCQRQHIQLAALRYYLDRRTLEAHLSSLVEAAHVEQARGMLAGAPIFAVLTRQAAGQVSDHCDRWELDVRRVETKLPPMAELRQLTIPAASTCIYHHGSRWIVIALAVLAISAALVTRDFEAVCGGNLEAVDPPKSDSFLYFEVE
jgi:hypothetical protein